MLEILLQRKTTELTSRIDRLYCEKWQQLQFTRALFFTPLHKRMTVHRI